MGIHEFNENSLTDDEFVSGEVKYLVKGNQCRLLDGRRTPGYIEEYFEETAMFRWRITDFEDKGNRWDLPAEDIKSFQILKNSKELEDKTVEEITKKINQLNKQLVVEVKEKNKEITEEKIASAERHITNWFKENLSYLPTQGSIDLNSKEGNHRLIEGLNQYMSFMDMEYIEERTSSEVVLNPNSEWSKGVNIILAELGIVSYKNKMLRQKDIFNSIGGKEKVKEYIINRIAYVRAYFKLLGFNELILYRGMSTEGEWMNFYKKSLTSWTFHLEVALSFGDLDKSCNSKNGYVFKRAVPIENIFMTYLETESMNRQYKEGEAILFFNREKGYY